MQTAQFEERFIAYANSFLKDESDFDYHILLKREHTLRVAAFCKEIYSDNSLDLDLELSYLVGLFHDIGRFEQYTQFESFHDATTLDHGSLGKDILSSHDLLDGLSDEDKELITYTTYHHNKISIPENEGKLSLYTKLVRDADKLDIYHVLKEHLHPRSDSGTLNHHLPDTDGYSKEILEDIFKGKQICYTKRKNQNDMKLTMLNWTQDLHFSYSHKYILEQGYIHTFCDALPQTEGIKKLREFLLAHCEQKSMSSAL